MFSAKQIGLKVIMCWTIMKWNIRTLYGHLSSRYCSITVVDRTSTIIDIYAHLFQMSLMCLWWEIYGFCLLSFCQNERFLSFLSLYIFEKNVFIFQFFNDKMHNYVKAREAPSSCAGEERNVRISGPTQQLLYSISIVNTTRLDYS